MVRQRFFCFSLGLMLLLAAMICAAPSAMLADAVNPLSGAGATTFAGTYSDGNLTLSLSQSAGAYAGTMTLGGRKFPVAAGNQDQGLKGTFTVDGTDFSFTATLVGDGNTLTLISGGKNYTLTKSAVNPLANLPGSAAPTPAQPGPVVFLEKVGAFTTLGAAGAGGSGKTLFISLPQSTTLDSAITTTLDELGKACDAKPTLVGAFADSKSNHRGGATFTAKLNGQDLRGWIFCGLADQGATSSVVIAPANAPASDIATLFAFLPADTKMQEFDFPDGSGSVDLPSGWTTKQQSLTFGVAIQGPAGQTVGMGIMNQIYTPDGNFGQSIQRTYQIAMATYQNQMQAYQRSLAMHQQFPNTLMPQEPQKPDPPDPDKTYPAIIFCRYCASPEDVLKYYYPETERKAKAAGGPYTTLDKVIEVAKADPNPLITGDSAGIVYLAVSDHDGDKVTHLRALNRVETYPIFDGKNTWVVVMNVMRAPDATFDRDLPVMNAILSSFKLNNDVVTGEIQKNGEAVRKMGEDSERTLLKRAHDFDDQQAANFHEFMAQDAARQQAMHDSASDYIELIRGVRDVYDTKTGDMESVDLFNVNGIVEGMNEDTLDPGRFVQIPLRYER